MSIKPDLRRQVVVTYAKDVEVLMMLKKKLNLLHRLKLNQEANAFGILSSARNYD